MTDGPVHQAMAASLVEMEAAVKAACASLSAGALHDQSEVDIEIFVPDNYM